jgi:acetylglutamate kinase
MMTDMQEAITKAAVLIEALPYIQGYRGKTVVIKLGGSVMDDPAAEAELLRDVVFLHTVGMQPVIVHGGGQEISKTMDEAGLEPNFVHGLRYTDERTLTLAEQVLCGRISKRIAGVLGTFDVEAIALNSLTSCVLFAQQKYLAGEDNRRIDIGYVGDVQDVNDKVLRLLCQAKTVPVIAPIARDRTGGRLNVNADTAAGRVAAAVQAEKLVMVSDTHGIRLDPEDPDSLCPSLDRRRINELLASGTIGRGMIPKVEACLTALEAGTRKAHIIDGRIPHALLLEIFTDKGIGTEILQ